MIYGDYYNDTELLGEMNKLVESDSIKFVYKKHIDTVNEHYKTYIPVEEEEIDGYYTVKKDFEKYCAKIIDKSIYIIEEYKNGRVYEVNTFPEGKLTVSYQHLSYPEMTKKGDVFIKNFISRWKFDESMRVYKNMDIFPDPSKVPNGYYNLWKPFESEFITNYTVMEKELELILHHIKILCGHEDEIYEYFIKWIAFVIQFPDKKTRCPVFISKEGAGKGTMMSLFKEMLGSQKVSEFTNPERDIWGDFNGSMMNSYLVNINEVNKKNQMDFTGRIKGLITDTDLVVNQKGQSQIKIKSYHKFIFTTNNEDPVYTDSNDRRFLVIRSSDEKIGDLEYFDHLNKIIEDKNVSKTCYEYFKNLPGIKEFPTLPCPISKYHEDIKESNEPILKTFLRHLCSTTTEKELCLSSAKMYNELLSFLDNNGIKYDIDSRKLPVRISHLDLKSISKKKVNGYKYTSIDVQLLKKELGMTDNETKNLFEQ